MTDPLAGVVITAREVYDAVIKLTAAVDRLADRLEDHARDLTDHEARLRALEKARWPLPALAVLVSITALVLSFMGSR